MAGLKVGNPFRRFASSAHLFWMAVAAWLVLAAEGRAQSVYSPPYNFATVAGLAGSQGSADGTGSAARFFNPTGVAVDSSGNIYVADNNNYTIRKITSGGVVTTLAGSAGNIGSADGTGPAARFNHPRGVAVDGAGNIYVADNNNFTVRKVTPGGVVTTLAGLAGSLGSTDGTGSAARFYLPIGVAVDGSGNVYVADYGNLTIRKITSSGVVTTLAGSPGAAGSNDGVGSAARFNGPYGVAADAAGNVYVGDHGNDTIRKIAPDGTVTTLAGTAGIAGSTDGTGSAARFNDPVGVAVDGTGLVYVAEYANDTIRRITSAGVVTTLAGSAGVKGSTGGAGSAARFNGPFGIAVDTLGNVYVGDSNNNSVRLGAPGLPTAAFTIAPNPAAVGASVAFDGSSSSDASNGGTITAYVWDFGDGSAEANGVNPTHVYAAAGAYTTTLTVTDSSGLTGTATASVTINRAAQTINFGALPDHTYGDAPFALVASATSGLAPAFSVVSGPATVSGDTLTITGAGTVVVRASQAGDANFLAAPDVDQSFTAMKATASINLGNLGPTYDATPKSASATTTPAGLAVTFAYNGSGTTPVNAGSYAVIGTVNDANFAGSASGTLVIAQAPLTVTANDATRTYGAADPAFTAAFNGFVSGDSAAVVSGAPSFATPATSASGIGSYAINPSIGTLSAANYSFGSFVDGTLTVTKAPLTVTADDKRRVVGAANPPLTVSYAGFVNNETADALTVPPTAATAATAASEPGEYPISASGGVSSNYSFNYVDGTLTVGKFVIGDFNGDGHTDLLWENTAGVDRTIWYLNGTGIAGFDYLAGVPNEWHIVGEADFNGDGQTDILWEDTLTGDRSIWLMNGTSILNFAYLAYVDPVWHIAAVGDFNGDGKPDILWENAESGGVDRAVWFLNGTSISGFGYLAGIPAEWKIVGTGDFNGDGQTDIVWEDTLTGDRSIWLMNGTTILGFAALPNVAPAWHIAMVADFNGDGQPDLLWENRTTGDRTIWLMNGTTHTSSVYLAYVDPVWHIAP